MEALRVLHRKGSEALEAPEKVGKPLWHADGHSLKFYMALCDAGDTFQERAGRFKRFANLFYKFSPLLMRQCPMETVEAWKAMRRYLKPRSLIPALVQCNQPVDHTQVSFSMGSC